MQRNTKINIEVFERKGQNRIGIFYKYISGNAIDTHTRSLPGRVYSHTKRCWHIAFRDDYKDYLKEYYSQIAKLN